MFKRVSTMFALFISSSAFATGGGSLGGNGGGIIFCENQAPVVLDYYEALQDANGYQEALLDPNQLSESEFFKIILERIKLSEVRKKRVWVIESYGGGSKSLAGSFPEIQKTIGPVSSWAIVPPSRVHDESILYHLPKNCIFEQAAITRDFIAQNVAGNATRLSLGQQRILEVHEIIYAAIMGRTWQEFIISSTGVRAYVKTLLKKKVTYSELRLAYYQMLNPTDTFVWEKGDIKRASSDYKTNPFMEYAGPWFLDLKNGANDPACANVLVVAPLDSKQTYLYQYWYSKDSLPTLSTTLAPAAWSDLTANCHYLNTLGMRQKGLGQYVGPWPPSTINRVVSKFVMQYMEEKLNLVSSEYDVLMEKVATSLGWK